MVGIVAISGLSQGMLLPAIAMIFEQEGVSSSINGIHATALYIGILVISPFLENRCKIWNEANYCDWWVSRYYFIILLHKHFRFGYGLSLDF